MGKVYLLDCTLRDGGYVNDWMFGAETIRQFSRKIALTGIELYEVGFIKGDAYDPDRAVFPDVASIGPMISPKAENLVYVAMLDMSAPVPIERIPPRDGTSVDGLRVIFKKSKIREAYAYCEKIKELGYMLFVQFVGTDEYSDKDFIETIEYFNSLHHYCVSIVDSFGLMKRKQFSRLVSLADNNLAEGIVLGYHAHNNLQQAFSNAEAMVEMNLRRDVCIDACVFGMGRGAGNLNLELFAEYMNENYGAGYRIEPMLEILDEYLNDIYKERFWGYSLPLYLSATHGCHPNYAIYLAEKDSLTVKSFHELLKSLPPEEKRNFTKERAENAYRNYQESFFDDRDTLKKLTDEIGGRDVLLLAPGKSLVSRREEILSFIKKRRPVVVCVNFRGEEFSPDYIFSSNMRRYIKIGGRTVSKTIVTSNMHEAENYAYKINFGSYTSEAPVIRDNSGVMALKLLSVLGTGNIFIAGMDGYTVNNGGNYFEQVLEYDFSDEIQARNAAIAKEIKLLRQKKTITFLTPTLYETN